MMDDIYQINVAKTEFREAYNRGDVDQLLSVFEEQGFTDLSEGGPSLFEKAARNKLHEHSAELFAEFTVRLAGIISLINVLCDTSHDYWWHQISLSPQKGGERNPQKRPAFEIWE